MCDTNTIHIHILQGVSYLSVFLVGLLLNMASLRVFFIKRATWTDTHIFMLNLAAADCALILFLPFRIYDAFQSLPITPFCSFLISTHYINMYASIFTVTAISVHRFLVVKFPFQTRAWRSKKVAVAVCGAIWVMVVMICGVFSDANHPQKLLTCYQRCKEIPLPVGFLAVLEVLGYLLPLLIIVFCSTQTIMVLLKEKDQEETTVEKRNIIGIITANLIVFVVCYTPIHLGFLLKYLAKTNHWETLDWDGFWQVCEWIATTNCFLDSISYYFLLKQFYSKASRSAEVDRGSEIALTTNQTVNTQTYPDNDASYPSLPPCITPPE
ncbi:G-protein coupled receptor 55 [Salmo salar]|uniref:G-protein coupled receptor 55 n=1 Tax=Salmo salar TaxID=8030 RepID=A0A1S3R318_SALSA|nr:G-protein coupled receptor 55 [Salmo salar]|eukprot:XP_014046753.1 PREDICTED: G-protein coupled receptor 55-like [Salmo salar]